MGWIVAWLILGLIAGGISSGRGNGYSSGFMWGLLLGPLGVLIALLGSPNAAAVEERQIVAGVMRLCPSCAEAIRVEAAVCRYCGRDVPALDAMSVRQQLVLRSQRYFRQHGEPHHREWLRRELVRDGYDPQVAEAAIVEAWSLLHGAAQASP